MFFGPDIHNVVHQGQLCITKHLFSIIPHIPFVFTSNSTSAFIFSDMLIYSPVPLFALLSPLPALWKVFT